MKVTIIGTGRMGRAIASRAVAGGHEVEFIGTHISKAQALADEMIGEGSVQAADLVHGDLVALAVPYTEAPHVVRQYSDQLNGTVIVDPTNPVDFSIVEPLDGDWLGSFRSGSELIEAEAPAFVLDGGMRPIDAGRLVRARELEAMALLHMEIQGSLRTGFGSAIKVVP
jgi:8-hydroxy-5-deazaflavin:NADPH oxidoreductase